MQATLHNGSDGLVVQIPASLATQAGLQAGMDIEIVFSDGQLVLVPKSSSTRASSDPILGLGQQPVACQLPDAAENHDRYLYGSSDV